MTSIQAILATVLGPLELSSTHGNGLLKHGFDVIDVPIDDFPGPAIVTLHTRNVLIVDNA